MIERESNDRRWLGAAARLASAALGQPGTGPKVGALIVDEELSAVVGRGVTPPGDAVQAELIALGEAGDLAATRTLYLTLEPSARFTDLAPTTGAIADSGIARVVVGALDPDPDYAGQGLADLVEGGVEAVCLDDEACGRVNEGYAARVTKGRPFITLRLTLTADEMVGLNRPGDPPLGPEALRFLQRERAAADAVLSGAARARLEDNDLRIHLDGLESHGALRVLLAGHEPLDPGAQVFADVPGAPLLVITTSEQPLSLGGVETLSVFARHSRPDLREVMSALAARGINRLFVEAGAKLAEAFIAGELVDRLHIISTDRTLGASGVPATAFGSFADRIAAARFSQVDHRVLGEDNVRTFARH